MALPNPLPLIHTALARCENVALAVPANFNVADLRLGGYELVLQKAEIDQKLWYLNAYYRHCVESAGVSGSKR